MKNKAINALIEMGMPAGIKGFKYIADAMCLFEEDDWRFGKVTALYYKIGQMNNATAANVERCIRIAFNRVISKGNFDAVEKYLTLQNVTNGNLLNVFYLRLTQED